MSEREAQYQLNMAQCVDVDEVRWMVEPLWDVPMLDPTMQAQGITLPLTKWGTIGRTRKMPGTYHFYTADYKFRALWNKPRQILAGGCQVAVEVNWSTGQATPRALALWDIYRKRWLARYWQAHGIRIFVDLNVEPWLDDIALLGVPVGWRAYATRWRDQDCAEIPGQHEVACERAGTDDVLFLVIGGRDRACELCMDRGWLWSKEHAGEVCDG